MSTYDPKLAFVASRSERAQQALATLRRLYQGVEPPEADIIIAMGGDGFVLETLHHYIDLGVPVYGMNRGSVGFLMNRFDEHDLLERLEQAKIVELHPLRMDVRTIGGEKATAIAINEVSLLRETRQASKIRIKIDGVTRLQELICDGVIVSTAAGSTAYNFSAHGPIIPVGADILALTPISAFRPRRWRGALLPHTATVTLQILESEKRPVSAVADHTEIRDVSIVEVREDRQVTLSLMFDPEHGLDERILREQFTD